MSAINVSSMRVKDLRAELKRRGLETKGLKAELLERYEDALNDEINIKNDEINIKYHIAFFNDTPVYKIEEFIKLVHTSLHSGEREIVLTLHVLDKNNNLIFPVGIKERIILDAKWANLETSWQPHISPYRKIRMHQTFIASLGLTIVPERFHKHKGVRILKATKDGASQRVRALMVKISELIRSSDNSSDAILEFLKKEYVTNEIIAFDHTLEEEEEEEEPQAEQEPADAGGSASPTPTSAVTAVDSLAARRQKMLAAAETRRGDEHDSGGGAAARAPRNNEIEEEEEEFAEVEIPLYGIADIYLWKFQGTLGFLPTPESKTSWNHEGPKGNLESTFQILNTLAFHGVETCTVQCDKDLYTLSDENPVYTGPVYTNPKGLRKTAITELYKICFQQCRDSQTKYVIHITFHNHDTKKFDLPKGYVYFLGLVEADTSKPVPLFTNVNDPTIWSRRYERHKHKHKVGLLQGGEHLFRTQGETDNLSAVAVGAIEGTTLEYNPTGTGGLWIKSNSSESIPLHTKTNVLFEWVPLEFEIDETFHEYNRPAVLSNPISLYMTNSITNPRDDPNVIEVTTPAFVGLNNPIVDKATHALYVLQYTPKRPSWLYTQRKGSTRTLLPAPKYKRFTTINPMEALEIRWTPDPKHDEDEDTAAEANSDLFGPFVNADDLTVRDDGTFAYPPLTLGFRSESEDLDESD